MIDNVGDPILDSGWIYRLHPFRETKPNRVCVLLHGWTGDEYSMDVFARAIPRRYFVLSPRAPYPTDEGGFGWVTYRPGTLAPLSEYHETASRLLQVLDHWMIQYQLPRDSLTLVGFSQGAAMALSVGLTFPERIDKIACLSGFLPQNGLPAPIPNSLSTLKVFISHGAQDTTIPIERAREAAAWLASSGAQVTKCESNVGHRLDATCFRQLTEFLT